MHSPNIALMMLSPLAVRCIALSVGFLLFTAAAQSREYYRYRNDQGVVVVDYQVPARYISGGYEVVNERGVVIKVVAPVLSEADKQQQSASEKQAAAAAAERERLREWDESLLLRYSTVADIEAARERALGDLRLRLSSLKGNRRSLKQKVETYQAEAADMERAGREVDVRRLQAIENLQQQIAATEKDIAEREREIAGVNASFQADIERFQTLEELVKLRRSMGAR